MEARSINQVFAENLRDAMAKKDLSQSQLAEMAHVSQKTVSNCLSPQNRADSASGIESSATLTNVDKIAKALEMNAWQMIRPTDARQRDLYEKIDDLVRAAQANESPEDAVTIPMARASPANQEAPEKSRKRRAA